MLHQLEKQLLNDMVPMTAASAAVDEDELESCLVELVHL